MLKQLADHWFLTEPALFALYVQQQQEENVRMDCAVRCGQGRLEYNPLILKHKNFKEAEQLVRIEMIRLFLKHPYEREPDGCNREAMTIGSNITIADGYCFLKGEKLPLKEPAFYHLPMGMYYEWYVKEISKQNEEKQNNSQRSLDNSTQNSIDNNSGQSSDNNNSKDNPDQTPEQQEKKAQREQSELWHEDSLQRQKIDELIERTNDWGTLPAEVVEQIKINSRATIDNHLIWNGFRSVVCNSARKLTRMRPNRRTGFLQMGNSRQFKTRLLVGIDVSGSITSDVLESFYASVNRLFHYGTSQIDICQFDADLSPVIEMKNIAQSIEITGRGGTSFEPIIQYVYDQKTYDGLIILTDGVAPIPQLPVHFHTPILWVCQNKQSYDAQHSWMEKIGRCCYL